jgi:hypothetical protein
VVLLLLMRAWLACCLIWRHLRKQRLLLLSRTCLLLLFKPIHLHGLLLLVGVVAWRHVALPLTHTLTPAVLAWTLTSPSLSCTTTCCCCRRRRAPLPPAAAAVACVAAPVAAGVLLPTASFRQVQVEAGAVAQRPCGCCSSRH